MSERVGRYRIERKLGEGGMGVVYAAHDEQLDRSVALKLIREAGADEQARKRFWREARLAASLNHPNVCQLHEIGEDGGRLFIAMELLEGEPLAERIRRGPLTVAQAVEVALGVLAALAAIHERGLVHRDLKPSNVFLTPHGVKLLDFGLARPVEAKGPDDRTVSQLTQAGAIVGTPHYMAPEQIQGQELDGRCDLFAVGAILFEMVAGRRAFSGGSLMEVLHATLYEQPPALGGSPAVAVVDRVVRRGLSKKPQDRYPSAVEMASDLGTALGLEESGPARVVAMTRLIVLPFRVLRPDPEIDFLAFSLPDAITGSLSGLESLVVRSSLAASRFAGEAPDLGRIAREADVDVVLTGTLLRSGEQLRVSTQLVEAPGGTLIWSQTSQATVTDVFQLQDELVHRIVDSLSLPLTAREDRMLRRDVPATAKAYEFYLRANQVAFDSKSWDVARQLYEQCVAEDPRYAPAWARLGRIYRVLAKYASDAPARTLEQAESAFRRAIDLNPELPLAHNLYAQFEVEAGRAKDALLRLLGLGLTRSADPELYTGLVHVCRYCGLLEASLAADRQARHLDPGARTSVGYTHFMLGDYDSAMAEGDEFVRRYALAASGRSGEALEAFRALERGSAGWVHELAASQRALLEGKREECRGRLDGMAASPGFRDPEGLYFLARSYARIGAAEKALGLLGRVVEGGFWCVRPLEADAWLEPLRAFPSYTRLVEEARSRHREAAAAFIDAGGERLLGKG